MNRPPGLDPEVLADLRHREASERDRSRSSLVTCKCGHHVRSHDGTTGLCSQCACEEFERAAGGSWSPPPIVDRWPCTGCNTLVDMTSEVIEMHAMFSRQLERSGGRPLAKRIPCPDCKRRDDELRAMEREAKRPMQQTELPGSNPVDQRPSDGQKRRKP
jgi:hypothetical protein